MFWSYSALTALSSAGSVSSGAFRSKQWPQFGQW